LAIELAAAHVRLFPPPALLRRLDRRLALLVGGPHDLPPRQRTLRATLDWSYSLLAPAERTLMAHLAVFVGGRTLEAIEIVCNPTGTADVLAGVEAFLQQSLLRQEEGVGGEPRYALLDTIHEYARERLEASGEAAAVGRRHAEYFLGLAEAAEPELQGPQQGEGGLELRLAGALGRFWLVRAHLSEGRRWLEGLLARPVAGPATAHAKVLQGAAELAYRQGDYAQSQWWGEASLREYRAAGERAGMAAALNNLGNVAVLQAAYDQATVLLEESLALRRAIGDHWGIGVVLNNLGTVALQQAHYSRAATLFEESLALKGEVGDKWGSAISLDNLGEVAQRQGDCARATALHEQSLALCRELGDNRGSASVLHNLGELAQRQGDHARAGALFGESLLLRRDLGDKLGVIYGLEGLAAVAAVQGRVERAGRLWGAATASRAALGTPVPRGRARLVSGLWRRRGQPWGCPCSKRPGLRVRRWRPRRPSQRRWRRTPRPERPAPPCDCNTNA
jgi:tetratricopeptide (TPR) repeat protein